MESAAVEAASSRQLLGSEWPGLFLGGAGAELGHCQGATLAMLPHRLPGHPLQSVDPIALADGTCLTHGQAAPG